MGCNTSSEAKNEKDNVKENQANTNKEEKLIKSDSAEDHSEVKAATKIQAAFRGHQTRKSMSMKAATNHPSHPASQPAKQPAKQAEKQPEKEPTKAELEAEFRADDKDLCNAATKIQASFRGHQARKDQAQLDQAQLEQAQLEKAIKDQAQQDKEDIEKIDLSDPGLNKAATKIQASFRGHKVRKDVK